MITLPATIEGFASREDKTLKITLGTQELPPDKAAELMNLHQKLGWFAFSENLVDETAIPKEPAPEFKGDKSPSQRLRAVVYRHWQKNTSQQINFNDFYKQAVEKIIAAYKEKLN